MLKNNLYIYIITKDVKTGKFHGSALPNIIIERICECLILGTNHAEDR